MHHESDFYFTEDIAEYGTRNELDIGTLARPYG